MTRRAFIIKALVLITAPLMASQAMASGGGEKKEEGGDPYVKLASVAIPIMANSRVVNYIFLTVKINLTPKANMTKLREKEPYFRDALVRTANKTSLGQSPRDDLIDEPKFQATIVPVFTQIAGAGAIESVEILAQMPSKKRGPLPVAH